MAEVLSARAQLCVLLIEDETENRERLRSQLETRGAEVRSPFGTGNPEPGPSRVDVALVVLRKGREGLLELALHAGGPGRLSPPLVVIGLEKDPDLALAALRADAYALLCEPVDPRVLWAALERAVHHQRLQHEVQRLREGLGGNQVSANLATSAPEELLPLAELERRHILRVLEAVRGNKALAARVLQLDRTTLYRKLERYGLGARGAAR